MIQLPLPSASLRAMLRPIAGAAVALTVVFLGGFAAWGAYAPLSSAAIATGVVSPESSRKTIQHLEGGIVQDVLVREGDRVDEGDVLLRLAPTLARASFAARQRQWQRHEAERLRLKALSEGAETLVFTARLAEVADPDFQAFLANQQALFAVQRRGVEEKSAILNHRIAQFEQEIAAIERENEGLVEQLGLLHEEIADKDALLQKQLIRKPELLVLQRHAAQLKAKVASNEATIARARQKIHETALAILQVRTDFQDLLAKEVVRVNSELAQLEEAMATSEDVFERTEIRAPVAGTVLNLNATTVGGIIRPGEPILDLVPSEDALLIEARLSPNDIDIVSLGQPARVHLTPFASRHVPPLEGRLTHISADSTIDQVTQERYYQVRVEVDPEVMARMTTDVELTPGMPAEIYIVTGERSLFDYFITPVKRSFRRAFREA
jgi:HlyD family secretion protein